MDNKIASLITRGEIRDAFDNEFLLRKGITLPEMTIEDKSLLKERLKSFRENDFKIKLGSILDEDMRYSGDSPSHFGNESKRNIFSE